MKEVVFAGIFALAASNALAQTTTEPEPAVTPESTPPGTSTAGPANLCQELLAYVRESPPDEAAPAGAAAAQQSTAAAREQAAAAPAQPAGEDDTSGDQQAAAGEDSMPASGEGVPPQDHEETGSAQDVSGQSGPAHEAPDPNSAQAAEGNVENAPQTSGLSAPIPVEPAQAVEETLLPLAEVEELASANDIAACQDAARKLRLAGAPMPPPLLALTALDLQYQSQATDTGSPSVPDQSESPAAQPPQ